MSLPVVQSTGDGRVFRATLVSHSYAASCWSMGKAGSGRRPVFAVFAGPTQEMRPFMANLKLDGKLRLHEPSNRYSSRAKQKGEPMEFMRSAAYNVDIQVHGSSMLATVYQPTLYYLEPIGGIQADEQDAEFSYVCMPGMARLLAEANKIDNAAIYAHLDAAKFGDRDGRVTDAMITFGAHAALFAAGIGRRIDIPIIHDLRFYAQLAASFLNSGLATFATPEAGYSYGKTPWGHHHKLGYHETGVELAGYAPGICVNATQALARSLISQETARFELILGGLDAGPPAIPRKGDKGKAVEDEPADEWQPDQDPDSEESAPEEDDLYAPDPEDLTVVYGSGEGEDD